ncbi:hypothetical protein D6833_00265 [Candidatus Parcubacteria bacterium]|nr:MAG: hypothetical protein D6833_00265 [Candidatus Parcubacteria bacterium]
MPDFGDIITGRKYEKIVQVFKESADETVKRVQETFGVALPFSEEGVVRLENLIAHLQGMPGDIDLFVHDFGCYLGEVIVRTLNGKWIIRDNLIHSSVLVDKESCQSEYFPFHKVYKRITNGREESLVYFYRDAANK